MSLFQIESTAIAPEVTGARMNWKPLFKGPVMVKPLRFNPNAQELIKIKQIPEGGQQYVQDAEYTKVEGMKEGELNSYVDLLCEFNPYAPQHPEKKVKVTEDETKHGQFEGEFVLVHSSKKTYPDKLFITHRVTLKKELQATTEKCLLMDDKLVTAWVAMKPGDDIKAAINAAREANLAKEDKPGSYRSLFDINPDTARIAYKGEVDLYNLLFSMAGRLRAFRPSADGKPNNTLQKDFTLGANPSQAYLDIFNGGQRVLNNILEGDAKTFAAYRDDKGEILKFGVMLVVTESDKNGVVKGYQETMTAAGKSTTCQYDAYINPTTKTWLGKDVINGVLNNPEPTYAYKKKWSLTFVEHTLSAPTSVAADETADKTAEGGISTPSSASDDLPF